MHFFFYSFLMVTTLSSKLWFLQWSCMHVRVETIKKAERWRTDGFELWCCRRLFEGPLDCKEIQPVHPKGNQSWIFTGKTDAVAEAPLFWLPDAKSRLLGKAPDAGKDWGQKKKMRWLDSITDSIDMNLSKLREIVKEEEPGVLQPWGNKESDTS